MSIHTDVDVPSESVIANTDEGCRILTISSTLESAEAFVERLKALSASRSSTSVTSSATTTTTTEESLIIPWTISNRYYTANVHFSLRTIGDISTSPGVFSSLAPAVVYVWVDGEPYEKHIAEIAGMMRLKEYEPEVSLAVRMPPASASTTSKEIVKPEDVNSDIDSTLMGFGFEYVDATRVVSSDEQARAKSGGDEEDDIPALPRVLDALSTIMWPSMRSRSSTLDLDRDVDTDVDVDAEEKEELMKELLATRDTTRAGTGTGEDEESQELMAQMRAFVQDAERKNVGVDSGAFSPYDFGSPMAKPKPWVSTLLPPTGGVRTMSPTEMDVMTPFGSKGPSAAGKQVSIGFEDDFTVFVSAPGKKPFALDLGEASFDAVGSEDVPTPTGIRSTVATAGLGPDSASYRSLGSVSDFGDMEEEGVLGEDQDEWEDVDSSDDEGLPSEEEVRAATTRIFGDGDLVGVLDQYRSEIAGMEDEDERRKTAAQVALGLVYGLKGK